MIPPGDNDGRGPKFFRRDMGEYYMEVSDIIEEMDFFLGKEQ
jgi:hypothetical protein